MKILHVIQFFSPSFGGSVMIPYHLSNGLVKEGHDVTIITSDYNYDSGFAQSLNGVEVIPFKVVINYGMFFYSPEIKKWLKDNLQKFDIIHLHNFRSYQNVVVSRYAHNYGIPVIIQPHGSFPKIIEKKWLKYLFDIVWGKNLIKLAKQIVAVSQSEVKQLKQKGIPDEKITVIPNGIAIKPLKDLPPFGYFRKNFGINQKFMILFVGRIHKIKGIDFLIRSFSIFVQNWDKQEVALIIIGPDEGYRSNLENLVKRLDISKYIKFIDNISCVNFAYQDADLLVYPSIYEIFGLVPFEAVLCGTPVIVTDGCGCGEIVKEAECGYIIPYGDELCLAEMINYVLLHPEENRKKILCGKNYIYKNLDWVYIVKRVEKIYENLIICR
ncbi:glycosyltransferase family 4 protein [Methanomicrobium antiquum]|uniref:Glycosyltransferase family 4 protein n=1 Tax=Methanomicrobium antiquum TaxID=487686 RepID=A0AAF0FWR7_9EURY|nr:glycosyltransferase family 4 protein [Methanomicrobium antiquum]WFN37400.1 glycosyltransferase family 4 protein [Methanomicrobium antiquum]